MAERTRLQQQISLDPERAAWLREEAKRTDLTMSQLVRRALDEYRARRTPMTSSDQQWAQAQVEAMEPTKEGLREFDQSADGARFAQVTGMTMWENLGGDTLPTRKMLHDEQEA